MSKTDKSLEPLLNSGDFQGDGAKVTAIAEIGAVSHRTPITINNTAQQITIAGNKGSIEFENTGSKVMYRGGLGVTSSNGLKFFPRNKLRFTKVKSTFSIYFVTDGADTSELRINEYST